MIKCTYIIALFVLISCEVSKELNQDKPDSSLKSETPKVYENLTLGMIDLTDMEVDSFNDYGGAGDCWGKVIHYTLPNNYGLSVDSFLCGQYGRTISIYILSKTKFIQAARFEEYVGYINPESNSFNYVRKEIIYDYTMKPPQYWYKVDTTTSYINQLPDSEFSQDSVEDRQTTYEHLEIAHRESWSFEFDYP